MEKRARLIGQALESCRLGKPLVLYDEVGSTSDQLKAMAEAGAPEGCTVVASSQTRGRGRHSRRWLSPAGKGLYLSVLLRPPWPAGDTPMAGMLAAVTVAQVLEAAGIRKTGVKWPNDVLVDGRKIAGVLVEPRVTPLRVDFIVLGIGVNVRQDPDDLRPLGEGLATSCRLEGLVEECDALMIRLLRQLDVGYAALLHNGPAALLSEWARRQAKGNS